VVIVQFPAGKTKQTIRLWQAAEIGFLEVAMRNIDSTLDSATHKRFVTAGAWIRKLRIINRFSSFSAAC
jgi:hypothetical protein